MSFATQYALATNTVFLQQVQVAMMTAGVNVAAEAKGAQDNLVFNKRQQLAKAILTSAGASTLQMFAWATITNAAITGASLDSDIQFQVNAVFSDLASVSSMD